MKAISLLQGAGFALGSVLLAQVAWAQGAPVAPLELRQVAVTQQAAIVGKGTFPTSSTSIRIYCGPSCPAGPSPLMLINSRVLVGPQLLAHLNPQDISTVRVHKDATELPGWPAFTSAVSGLIDIQLKPGVRLPSISLSRLKRRLHLKGPVQFEQYGQLLPVAQLRIAKVDSKAVTVRVVAPGDVRLQLAASAPPVKAVPLPPGAAPRVMIRGVARQ